MEWQSGIIFLTVPAEESHNVDGAGHLRRESALANTRHNLKKRGCLRDRREKSVPPCNQLNENGCGKAHPFFALTGPILRIGTP